MSRTFMGSVILFPPTLVIILPQQFVLLLCAFPASTAGTSVEERPQPQIIMSNLCGDVLSSSMQGMAANLDDAGNWGPYSDLQQRVLVKEFHARFRSTSISRLPFDPVHESLAGTTLGSIMRG
ncbi:hypothetical protein EV421DRAFT_1912993 [Armillaria borealis]|uniref:Secreted protein n=1 Tax=Armillaria borealis TaxID=47425 RepID=A0AA39IVK7_9AGAR|nr:hypothetical protein EV421DRAFT_1912993 [Armillaria borealis]